MDDLISGVAQLHTICINTWILLSHPWLLLGSVLGKGAGEKLHDWLAIRVKLRITVQPVMQKARVVEPKTQRKFVDSHESSVRELVWWAWLQPFAKCIDLKCCKFLA